MAVKRVTVGTNDTKARSDCYVELELRKTGGIKLKLESKVESLYGKQIRDLVYDICKKIGLTNAVIVVKDFGALPFTIAARIETAIKRLYPDFQGEYLLPFNSKNGYGTTRDRLRRSRLYLPGNSPKLFMNAGLHKPDGIILDLEDSVAPAEKDAAQILVRNALRTVDFYGCERMVRINQLPMGLADLDMILPHNPNVILIPKVESREQIYQVELKILEAEKSKSLMNNVYLMPIIESALGIERAFEIASASELNCALAIGLEDYTADIGAERTKDGIESFYARSVIVNAAVAAGIQPIDTVFSDVSDTDGLRASVMEAKSLGFVGKGCIHPRQIKIVHEAFHPTDEEIEKAQLIVDAYKTAKAKGLGVVSIGSKMIDAPVVKRAERIVSQVRKAK